MELEWTKKQNDQTAYIKAVKDQAERQRKEAEILRSESYVRTKKGEIDRQKREERRIKSNIAQIVLKESRLEGSSFGLQGRVRQKELEIKKMESDLLNQTRMIRDEKEKEKKSKIIGTKISQAKTELQKMQGGSSQSVQEKLGLERQREQYEQRLRLIKTSISSLDMDIRQLEGKVMRLKSEIRR